ncbi:MAG: hypothetical protein AAF202_06705, partial [Pseudomonadota bacterium]
MLSPTACSLKWTDLKFSVWEHASSSCRLATPVKVDSSFDLHNSPQVIRDRKRMQEAEWPQVGRGCEGCQRAEALSGNSPRREGNKAHQLADPTEERFEFLRASPTHLEISFNNKCNMKCVYCGPIHSSSWVAEINDNPKAVDPFRFEYDTAAFVINDQKYQETLENTWGWLRDHADGLNSLTVSGGEPFLQKEVWDLVHWLADFPNANLHLMIQSNLQIEKAAFELGVQKLLSLAN